MYVYINRYTYVSIQYYVRHSDSQYFFLTWLKEIILNELTSLKIRAVQCKMRDAEK